MNRIRYSCNLLKGKAGEGGWMNIKQNQPQLHGGAFFKGIAQGPTGR